MSELAPFAFEKLPYDIRANILQATVTAQGPVFMHFGRVHTPSIMRANKQIRAEILHHSKVEVHLLTAICPAVHGRSNQEFMTTATETFALQIPPILVNWITLIPGNQVRISKLTVAACRVDPTGKPTHIIAPRVGPSQVIPINYAQVTRPDAFAALGINAAHRLFTLRIQEYGNGYKMIVGSSAAGQYAEVIFGVIDSFPDGRKILRDVAARGVNRWPTNFRSAAGVPVVPPFTWDDFQKYVREITWTFRDMPRQNEVTLTRGLTIDALQRLRIPAPMLKVCFGCDPHTTSRLLAGETKTLVEIAEDVVIARRVNRPYNKQVMDAFREDLWQALHARAVANPCHFKVGANVMVTCMELAKRYWQPFADRTDPWFQHTATEMVLLWHVDWSDFIRAHP